jgi:hypothetical protein
VGARDGTAAPPPGVGYPLIEVSTLALRVHNRRVAAAPLAAFDKDDESEEHYND